MKRRTFLISISALITAIGGGWFFWQRRWKYIVIHHSAGDYGNLEFLQQVHRERQKGDPIDAIPYHYIIGNGNGMEMGKVVAGWRTQYDIWGMHVSARNIDRNFRGIGICLIGNFEYHKVPGKQYLALVELTKTLMRTYDIKLENINGHGLIAGEATKCPGKNFPIKQFLEDIS